MSEEQPVEVEAAAPAEEKQDEQPEVVEVETGGEAAAEEKKSEEGGEGEKAEEPSAGEEGGEASAEDKDSKGDKSSNPPKVSTLVCSISYDFTMYFSLSLAEMRNLVNYFH